MWFRLIPQHRPRSARSSGRPEQQQPEDRAMRTLRKIRSKLLLVMTILGGAVLFHEASAAVTCADMPSSQLQIFDIKASAVHEIEVSKEELTARDRDEDLVSRHTLMLSLNHIVTWFDIMHRMIPREGGLVCDAPSFVRMGFGVDQRVVLLARPAAADACVHQAMLTHEAVHAQALSEAVDRFIDQHTKEIRRGVIALKETPAPVEALAKARWEVGLRTMMMSLRQELFAELRAASSRTDGSAAIATLEDACGGKIRRLESHD
jgi:hypothetical protein